MRIKRNKREADGRFMDSLEFLCNVGIVYTAYIIMLSVGNIRLDMSKSKHHFSPSLILRTIPVHDNGPVKW